MAQRIANLREGHEERLTYTLAAAKCSIGSMNGFNDTSTTTNVLFSSDARKKLAVGLKVAAEAVSCTLGPRGRTVLIQKNPGDAPMVTKDGYTVSKSIVLKDPIERMGAQLILEAAGRTNEVAGDGTTTATVLTIAMVNEGMKLVEAGYSPQLVCLGIEEATAEIVASLALVAKKLTTSDEVAQVGTISANGDATIGKLIASAMEKVGRDGIITVEDAKGMATTLEIVEGMMFERGYISPYFVTNTDRMVATYRDAAILVTDKKLSSIKELIPVLEACVKMQKPLLIIAEDVEGDALQGLVLNRARAQLQVVAIKAPGFGQHRNELLNDICVLTNATLVSSATGKKIEDVRFEDLGRCKKIVVDAKNTTLVGSGDSKEKEALEKHVNDLREQMTDVSLSSEDAMKLKQRVAKLAAGVAIIKVGGTTEVEMTERKHRVEDALNATKAATEEGIVPGGGMALLVAAETLGLEATSGSRDHQAGFDVVYKACFAPIRRIVKNAGGSGEVVIDTLKKDLTKGYNAATERYVDLVSEGVIDPVKVTRTALQNAASVAITFLSLDAVICNDEANETKR